MLYKFKCILSLLLSNKIHVNNAPSFVRGGSIHLWYGSLMSLGYYSLYWTAAINPSNTNAYHQACTNKIIRPSSDSIYANAFFVRCLAL